MWRLFVAAASVFGFQLTFFFLSLMVLLYSHLPKYLARTIARVGSLLSSRWAWANLRGNGQGPEKHAVAQVQEPRAAAGPL